MHRIAAFSVVIPLPSGSDDARMATMPGWRQCQDSDNARMATMPGWSTAASRTGWLTAASRPGWPTVASRTNGSVKDHNPPLPQSETHGQPALPLQKHNAQLSNGAVGAQALPPVSFRKQAPLEPPNVIHQIPGIAEAELQSHESDPA